MFRFLKVEVLHWDYWERFSLPLEANVITVVGPNGSGKTTLLDALRTLLCIDCSTGRDYKRYVRHSDKPLSWLRAVVANKRQDSGWRPFFPFMAEQVTLACQIRKKGGDWERQYLLAEGDVAIENLEGQEGWIGVRDYRQRLEQAGLTHAIRHVLALEQGDTDKLCEYTPRQLLELVFSVFGDQEVLDNYQQAKNEQTEIGRELEKLEEELARLGVRLRQAEADVNSFQQWRSLKTEWGKLSSETLSRAELADLHERVFSGRTQLRKLRSQLKGRQQGLDNLRSGSGLLLQGIEAARSGEKELETAEEAAHVRFISLHDAARDAERILADRARLEELCRQQEAGLDTPALATEQREAREKAAANDHELKAVRRQLHDLRTRMAALKAGGKIEPDFVRDFRRRLDQAHISHRLLTEIVEVTDAGWQKALEGVLGPYAHIVLLTDPAQRQQAWKIGEELRYRHFVVAELSPLPAAAAGSLLEVAAFREKPPAWLAERLNRIRRVESVREGSSLPGDIPWVTREGYHRERRGGRYIGVDPDRFLFGEAARRNYLSAAEKEETLLREREKELSTENDALSRRIDEIQMLLNGVDAARQLAARASEFTRAEKEFPLLAGQAQEAADLLADCGQRRKAAGEKRQELEVKRGALERDIEREGETLRWDRVECRAQKTQQVGRIIEYRRLRSPMPVEWYTRQAMKELSEQYESAEAVRREIRRLEERLEQGSWVTDEQVLAVKDKLQGDHANLAETIDVRRTHHRRHVAATEEARASYINVLRATVRRYSHNVRALGELAGIGVEVEPPHLVNEDLVLAQAGLTIKFDFDQKGMIGLNDGEASGGQQVMKSLILLIGLLMDESRPGGFVFIDEPFAHLDVFNIDKVGAFLEATRAQYVLTTPNTHNVNVFMTSDLTLVTQKRRHPERWAPPVAFLRREKPEHGRKRDDR